MLRVLAQEPLREPHDVVAALAQRRQVNVDRVQAIQQIRAEAPRRDLAVDVGVRRREHAHVDALRARRAEPLELAVLRARAAGAPCCATGMFAISSRNSVPPSASSKRPTRSFFASVNAPLTWPNISLSNTVSARLPMLTVTRLRSRRGERVVNQPRDEPLAAAALARDQHVRIRRRDALDRLEHGLHRRRFGDQRVAAALELPVLGLERARALQRPAERDLRAQHGRAGGRCPTASR